MSTTSLSVDYTSTFHAETACLQIIYMFCTEKAAEPLLRECRQDG